MRAELSLLAGDVVLYRAVFAVSDDRLRGDRGIGLMLINQLHQFMRLIDPAGRRVNRSDDSVGVIDHPVIFIPWPSFESVLTHQCGFWIRVALILLVYFRTRTWSGHTWVLIVIGLVLFSVCFVELLSLLTASLSDLIQSSTIQLTNRVQRCVGID